jgi:hypothetical protein
MKFIQFAINRLKEGSTYAGLVLILSVFGVSISPEQKEAIMALGGAIAGAILVFFPNVFGAGK